MHSVQYPLKSSRHPSASQRFKSLLAGIIFGIGFTISVVLLIPTGILLFIISGIFGAADRCSYHLRHTRL